jgi:amidase
MAENLALASAIDLAEAVRLRKIAATELLEIYRARIETYNSSLNAVVFTDWERAFVEARQCDAMLARGEACGALHGVPMTVKDAFDVTSMPSTWGKTELASNLPQRNAVAVDRLQSAGAIIIGKTNVPRLLADHQTFNPVYGRTNNPWNLETTPGGSSGGAAAALAAGMTGLELGSDIGGSIRHPSHCCGTFGHKPTIGVCPTRGHDLPGDLAPLDMGVIGPMARSAHDLELGLSILAGPDSSDAPAWRLTLPEPRGQSLSDWRIGILLDDEAAPVDHEVQSAIQALADFLAARGARISDRARPIRNSHAAFSLYIRLLRSATTAHLPDDEIEKSRQEACALSADASGYVADTLRGRTLSHRDWLLANEERYRLKCEWDAFFGNYDLLLCPAACRAAAPHDEVSQRHERTFAVNGQTMPGTNDLFWAGLTGMVYLPSTVAPIGLTREGLPVGVQIVGRWYDDRSTIAFARLLEQEFRAFVAPPGYA